MLAAALALLSALPYLIGGVSGSFIALDDDKYVYENPQVLRGLSAETALWALRSTEDANWYPLRRLSHLVDVSVFGLDARGHRWVSVGWHAAAALLLFAALVGMTGALWRCFLVAALFAAHPLQVESVAWVSERSNVLAGFFFALTLLLWARYARRPGPGRFGAVAAAFALGLMAKPILVTLPLVLLILDFWPLGRIALPPRGRTPGSPPPGLLRRILLEKAPLLLLAAGAGAMAVVAHQRTDSLSSLETLPLAIRLGNAALSYWRYLGKLLWPADLAVFYPHPGEGLPALLALAAALLAIAATALALTLHRRAPWLAAGWLWYAVSLAPMSGVVQFGAHAMADRFAYLPSIGVFLALVWLAAESLPARWRASPALALAASLLLSTLVAASAVQVGYWKNSETLFRRALAVTTDNWMIRGNLAGVLGKEGRHEEALAHASEAIRIQPGLAAGHVNRGFSLAGLRRWEESVDSYREALRLQPDGAAVHASLGDALAASGKHAEAVASYREALRLGADRPGISYNLGNSLAALGRHEEATASYRAALRLRPGHANAHANLGSALVALGRLEEAAASYRAALGIRPDPEDWYQLGLILDSLGRPDEAAASLRKALLLRPDHGAARAMLAQIQTRSAIGPGLSSR